MRLLFVFIIFFFILSSIIGFTPILREKVISLSYEIKNFYITKKEAVSEFIFQYTNQASNIEKMSAKILELETKLIEYQSIKVEFENLYNFLNIETRYDNTDVILAKVISYASFGNYTQVWINYQSNDMQKIFGIIKDGYAIGIAIVENNRLLGILNGDNKIAYSVYIGKNKVPGMIRVIDSKLLVDFVPSWLNIQNDDEVVTSGLDGVFFEGIKVGKISDIKSEKGYLQAKLTPYTTNSSLGYVWLIDTKIPQTITINQE